MSKASRERGESWAWAADTHYQFAIEHSQDYGPDYATLNLSEKFAPCAVAYADALLAELKKPEEVP